jgi:hypothetical protein
VPTHVDRWWRLQERSEGDNHRQEADAPPSNNVKSVIDNIAKMINDSGFETKASTDILPTSALK